MSGFLDPAMDQKAILKTFEGLTYVTASINKAQIPDASLRHKIDDREGLEKMEKDGVVHQALK